ncbi:MAG: tRNA uridine(34) 5-carboxymethylaminomethyl modification radical SAM/GNAT enzyme Elp3 [Methanosarcina flavescens]|uniref:tRNA carboxymethyluridine synthase n=1 Tax=Methanosarcina flavescens TaxID=1715806 RepID=A0A660HVQ3_9EURY|nr:elongator complex protein 3 [Methanosarcina flavescens]AYK16408.1 tRNA uridine(34) 5-carboxymethylaminomethyl modification radical SAM/GNAT enzyme Elp3 [Methanosarcina flavescens]NLK31669.1 tRNA uridine(34) 5-carboxymethylaminomethyl modification radical SAM/GNAT enzyme Elp3 [Methanosarcina flavescens]
MKENDYNKACREILERVLAGEIENESQLNKVKKDVSKHYHLASLPRNGDIITKGTAEEQAIIKEFLKRKPVRTISGVAVIAVMTSPAPCPHGVCLPCPGGPNSTFKSPQSYMGREPAAMRAIQHDFDPYAQVKSRLSQLKEIGHDVEKVELIVMGGTFSARNLDYQEWFIRRCLEAMNDFTTGKEWRKTAWKIGKSIPYIPLEEVQKANEKADIRNVGITFETRPDWAAEEHVDELLKLGGTKVELGVQSVYDFVLTRMQRGHGVAEVVRANQILRDSAFKVGFHMMPHLPGSDSKLDLRGFKKLFEDSRFRPDYLKIYPTLVTEGTPLYKLWEAGDYEALSDEEAAELIADVKEILPKWVRLQRIQRDIPAHQIFAGVRKSNLRQLAEERLREKGGKCRCIRCREVGHTGLRGRKVNEEDIELTVETYEACGGIEHFIAFEDLAADVLIGFARLRFPFAPYRPELQEAALIRELHVYGSMVPVGKGAKQMEWQHRGYGKELLEQAENITRENGYEKLAIISGIGAREYYRKFGYTLDNVYMSKILRG